MPLSTTKRSIAFQWKNHPATASSGITNGSPIINFNGFTVGPDGSIPQVIKQFNDSFRDDFTVTRQQASDATTSRSVGNTSRTTGG